MLRMYGKMNLTYILGNVFHIKICIIVQPDMLH